MSRWIRLRRCVDVFTVDDEYRAVRRSRMQNKTLWMIVRTSWICRDMLNKNIVVQQSMTKVTHCLPFFYKCTVGILRKDIKHKQPFTTVMIELQIAIFFLPGWEMCALILDAPLSCRCRQFSFALRCGFSRRRRLLSCVRRSFFGGAFSSLSACQTVAS